MIKAKGNYRIPEQINAGVFRAYDIRGHAFEALTEDLVYAIGLSIAAEAQVLNQTRIAVGRDGRLSSPQLFQALVAGLCVSGMHVIDIGIVPSPVLYYATYSLATSCGVIVTGSHNPKEDNGLKIVLGGKTLHSDQIQVLYRRIQAQDFLPAREGQCTQMDVLPSYIACVAKQMLVKPKLKVVVDCGNGVVAVLAQAFFAQLHCDVIPLYCTVDGNFPHHHPDPTRPENLVDLIDAVKQNKADIGFAFDGDGDRIVAVAADGQVIWPESLIMLFAKDVLKQLPKSQIVFDVKCSNVLAQIIEQSGGVPIMSKTGHSLLKEKMIDCNAPLAGELSGHIFFADKWYGFDDGLYVAARFLDLMRRYDQSSTQLLATLPKRIATHELHVKVPEKDKFIVMEQLVKAFQQLSDVDLCLIDGVRASYPQGWGLVRASNTTPCLTCRFEAQTQAALKHIQDEFKRFIQEAAPQADIPF